MDVVETRHKQAQQGRSHGTLQTDAGSPDYGSNLVQAASHPTNALESKAIGLALTGHQLVNFGRTSALKWYRTQPQRPPLIRWARWQVKAFLRWFGRNSMSYLTWN